MAVLAWMRTWLEQSKLPIPATIGDGFRTLAAGLARPGLRRQERNTLYGLAAMFARAARAISPPSAGRRSGIRPTRPCALLISPRSRRLAAESAEADHPQRDAGAGIAAAAISAAGSGHPAIARQQTAQLEQSFAPHPDQAGYQACCSPSARGWRFTPSKRPNESPLS
jgi:hypothetical protein